MRRLTKSSSKRSTTSSCNRSLCSSRDFPVILFSNKICSRLEHLYKLCKNNNMLSKRNSQAPALLTKACSKILSCSRRSSMKWLRLLRRLLKRIMRFSLLCRNLAETLNPSKNRPISDLVSTSPRNKRTLTSISRSTSARVQTRLLLKLWNQLRKWSRSCEVKTPS